MERNPGPDLQREVQRLMGRCLLCLQQYERLMKAVLARHELDGTPEDLESNQAARVKKFSNKSLGLLVEALFDNYVVGPGSPEPVLDESELPTDQISMSLRFRVQMTNERRDQTKAAIVDLVSMRNELVHHLIERFDLWTDQGCANAIEHLNRSYERICRHHEELLQWSASLTESRARTASLIQSEVFVDLLVNGIAPDGTFEWPSTGIVSVLREAVERSSTGWVRLDEAKAWISEHHPDQTPEKYGCRSWRQVLSESKCFRLERRMTEDGRRVAWYRALR